MYSNIINSVVLSLNILKSINYNTQKIHLKSKKQNYYYYIYDLQNNIFNDYSQKF